MDVFSKEFGAYSPEYYKDAIQSGRITVNGKNISTDTLLRNGDRLSHTVHRHEPPVPYEPVQILKETDDLIAVNKPAAIPVHTCGAYRYNTLEMILRVEHHLSNLFLIHRLDRVTSGVVLLAKTREAAARYSALLQRGGVHKLYFAEVEGKVTWDDRWDPAFVHRIDDGFGVSVGIGSVSQRDGIMCCDGEHGKVRVLHCAQ